MIPIEFYIKKMQEQGVTRYKLAKLCNITPQQVYPYFNGTAKLGSVMQGKFNEALNIKISYE